MGRNVDFIYAQTLESDIGFFRWLEMYRLGVVARLVRQPENPALQ